MFCFEILRIFGEKSQKSKLKNLGTSGSPCCGVDLRRSVGCLAAARPRCQNGSPRVRHGVAKLRRGKGLHRSVAVLRHSVDTVHNEQILNFCFRTPRIRTPIV